MHSFLSIYKQSGCNCILLGRRISKSTGGSRCFVSGSISRSSIPQQSLFQNNNHDDNNNNNKLFSMTTTTTTTKTRHFSTTAKDGDLNNNGNNAIPFYGTPGPPVSVDSLDSSSSLFPTNRLFLAINAATTALLHPERADMVAALGELTGTVSLRRMHQSMLIHPVGQEILKDRPIVSKATLPTLFPNDGDGTNTNISGENNKTNKTNNENNNNNMTFGQAYLAFLDEHGFDPDERDEVKYIDDPDLAYIMLRYRQCHDYWHALTGLPPTVLGELGIKWLELFQTGFPIACLSSTVGSLALTRQEQQVLFRVYLPWALRVHRKQQQLLLQQQHQIGIGGADASNTSMLLNVYYEKEFDTPLQELRDRLGIEPAPVIPEELL